jgi:hypothetical protein
MFIFFFVGFVLVGILGELSFSETVLMVSILYGLYSCLCVVLIVEEMFLNTLEFKFCCFQ